MSTVMIIWIVICVILSLIILVQKGKGGGLSGAFGGAGTGGGLLGTKTGDFLTWVTISFVGLFFLLAIVIGLFLNADDTTSTTDPATVPQTQTPTGGDTAIPQGEAAPVTPGETEGTDQPTEPAIPAGDTENTGSPAGTDTPE